MMMVIRAAGFHQLVSKGNIIARSSLAKHSRYLAGSHLAQNFSTETRRSMNTAQPELPSAWKKTKVARTIEDLQEAYAEWSLSYDKDSVEGYGYVA